MGWINLLDFTPRFFESNLYNQLTRCLKCWYEQLRGRTIHWIGQFQCRSIRKTNYPYICCMFCWALDTVMPLRRTMKPSLSYLEWVNRNWKKERTCLDGCFLFGACHVRHGLQTATCTLAHLTVWQTHTNISQILSQT